MSKGKKIYLGILLLVTLLVSTLYFSYAFFTSKNEEHGKLNIVAGTLNYKIESEDLENNQIEVTANTTRNITIVITDLNEISSKYELYYKVSDDISGVEVGYSTNTKDKPKGIIEQNGSKEIDVVIKNNSDSKVIITFGVYGGFSNLAYDDITGIGNSLSEIQTGDVILAWEYVGTKGEPSGFPSSGSGYGVESVECNGIKAVFNNITWQLTLPEVTEKEIICNFVFIDAMTSDTNLEMGDAVTGIDGSKWHVLEASASGTDTVVLLSDYNLNEDGTYNTECGRDINSTSGCSTRAYDSSNVNYYSETSTTNVGYFIKNTYEPLLLSLLPESTDITIPTAYQIATADGKTFNSSNAASDGGVRISSSWLTSTDYWTKTAYPSSSTRIWVMNSSASAIGYTIGSSTFAGVRPIITTSKANLIAE